MFLSLWEKYPDKQGKKSQVFNKIKVHITKEKYFAEKFS